MINVLITGAAGYIGQIVGNKLMEQGIHVIGLDIHTVQSNFPIHNKSILDPDLKLFLRSHHVTHVIHLASVLTSTGCREKDFEIDVLGTEYVFNACVEANVKHFTATSSGAAYGYHHDNPDWIKETDPLRGNYEFPYSWHKLKVEEFLATQKNQHPEIKQLILRPGTVLGATTRNQITQLFLSKNILAIKNSKSPFVFIWDQDLADIIVKGVHTQQTGTYNLAGTGALSIDEIAKKMGRPVLRLPAWLVKFGLFIGKQLRLSPYGPEQLNFLRYRPVLSNKKLIKEFPFNPRKNSEQTFDYFIEHLRPEERMR